MSHVATARYRIAPAPGGLALVQDLLNTRQIGPYGADLLATAESAGDWLEDTLPDRYDELPDGHSDRSIAVSERELMALRRLRSRVRDLVTGDPGEPHGPDAAPLGSASLMLAPSGAVRLVPAGRGPARIADAVWTEIFLAQQSGVWPRLKVCRSEPCGSAFYDRSRNNSGVWHDVRTCGNRENLRASRARRRAPESPAE